MLLTGLIIFFCLWVLTMAVVFMLARRVSDLVVRLAQCDVYIRFNQGRYPDSVFEVAQGYKGSLYILHSVSTGTSKIEHLIAEINTGDPNLNQVLAGELTDKLNEIQDYNAKPKY